MTYLFNTIEEMMATEERWDNQMYGHDYLQQFKLAECLRVTVASGGLGAYPTTVCITTAMSDAVIEEGELVFCLLLGTSEKYVEGYHVDKFDQEMKFGLVGEWLNDDGPEPLRREDKLMLLSLARKQFLNTDIMEGLTQELFPDLAWLPSYMMNSLLEAELEPILEAGRV